MWNVKKNTKANIVMESEFEDFASLLVEKKFKESIPYFTLDINIYDVLHEDLDFYKLDDLSNILKFVKNDIEYLYKNINTMSDDEYYSFIDDFKQKINEY